jgi:predicted AAA+ superfamily ATPase
VLRLDPLTLEERPAGSLEEALLDGALPAIRLTADTGDREADLRSYVETYLEEEVRQEALVRNVGAYGRFVELAAREAGRVANYTRISQDVGVSSVTIQSYYDILCDCLVAERVEPVTRSASRKKLTKASRFLLFDTGVARSAAREGRRLPLSRRGELFEQFIGIEAIRFCRLHAPDARLRFWRDPDGPEVDWVIEHPGGLLPIEVKLGDRPTERDTRHLHVFLKEYGGRQGLVVCAAPRPLRLTRLVTAVPWQDLPGALASALKE